MSVSELYQATSHTVGATDHAIKGGCHCGQIAFAFDGVPRSVLHCHCNQCRRLNGSAFTTWVSVAKDAFHLTHSTTLLSYKATPNGTRFFCSACGTHVFTEDQRHADIVGIPAGTIAGPLGIAAKGHYFVNDKAVWHTIADTLPQFGGESGFEPIPAIPVIALTNAAPVVAPVPRGRPVGSKKRITPDYAQHTLF